MSELLEVTSTAAASSSQHAAVYGFISYENVTDAGELTVLVNRGARYRRTLYREVHGTAVHGIER